MSADDRNKLSLAHYRIYGQCLLDMGLVWWARKKYLEKYIKVEGLEHYRAAIKSGRNIILLTGHFSALDIAGPAISRHHPQVGLVNPFENELVDYFIARGRRRFSGKVFLRDKGMRPIIKAIRAGYGFYYLPDEDYGPEKSIFVPFLGAESATITALNKLARLANAAVLPTSVRRVSAREGYLIKIHPAIKNFPGDDPKTDAARMNVELSKMVAEAPEQYMWILKIFTTRPDSTSQPYDSH